MIEWLENMSKSTSWKRRGQGGRGCGKAGGKRRRDPTVEVYEEDEPMRTGIKGNNFYKFLNYVVKKNTPRLPFLMHRAKLLNLKYF